MKIKILIVEDQFVEANNLQRILERSGYEVCTIARSVPIALKIIDAEHPDLVFLDIYLKGPATGIDLARELGKQNIAFVFLSANSSKRILDQAKSTKPYGFLVKPFREKDVLVMLEVAIYLHQQNKLVTAYRTDKLANSEDSKHLEELKRLIISDSPKMNAVLNDVKIVGNTDTTVLILGETGTGKELIAQAIHRMSRRSNKPFIVVNCGALPDNLIETELFGHEKGAFTGALNKRIGKFELADGGTIFLDEIGELPMNVQVKFLRVLQEMEIERVGGQTHKINIRVIAATNRNLEEEISAERFRLDLYYRLNVFEITLPPLRERKQDIPILAQHFITKYAQKAGKIITGFTDSALTSLMEYSWPGNVRELENLMERSSLLTDGPLVGISTLKRERYAKKNAAEEKKIKTIDEIERDHILSVLKMCNWRVSGKDGAAAMLNININTLNSKIKRLAIEKFSS